MHFNPQEELQRIDESVSFLRKQTPQVPDVFFILGSGLGEFAARVRDPLVIPYSEIPHFPVSAVVGHSGNLILGTVNGRRVAVLSGRIHYYEGYPMHRVVFTTRVLGRWGIPRLVVTNAAGAINRNFEPGDLMLISDHINLQGVNALQGPNLDALGERFFDMSEAYSPELRAVARQVAGLLEIKLQAGVYLAIPGPSYETPAEIEMFRRVGADAVGMSTVPEVTAARHMGVAVLGISCMTNMAAGVLPQKLVHTEVLETTTRIQRDFVALLEGIAGSLPEREEKRS